MKDFGDVWVETTLVTNTQGATHVCIAKHQELMEQEFGQMRFESALNQHGKPTEYVLLNENQAYT